MSKDVLITPASGIIEFYENAGNLEASIELDNSNNLVITGNVTLGDAGADVIIGDGVSAANVIFEQGGAVYGLATKTLTLGIAGSSLSLAANITSGANITGNVTGGNIAGTTGAFATVTGNANATSLTSGTVPSARLSGTYTITVSGSATTAGTVTTAAQPNITSVGTLSSLSVVGNVTGGNLVTAGVVDVGSITVATTIAATGNVSGNFFIGNGSQLGGINAFSTIEVIGQDNIVANSISNTLTIDAGQGIAIVTDAESDTLTISLAGAGSGIFASGGDMGTVDEAVTASTDLGFIIDSITETFDLGSIVLGGIIAPGQFILPSFTVAELANINRDPAGQMTFCTNEAGGSVPVFSDGTDWRRVTDRQIVS